MWKQRGGTSHSTPLQMSGADFIARLLQRVCQQVCLTIIMHWGRALLALFRPSARLLQSIAQMVLYYAKIAMKLIIMSSALQRDMLLLCTPLELAACFHLVEDVPLQARGHYDKLHRNLRIV